MSLIVNNVLDLKDGFNNFIKGTKSGPYQLFYFPTTAAEAANSKADLMKAFTTRPAFQWIEIDGRAIIQESVSLTEAAQKIIGPNFKQKTTNQDVYQLHNAPTYGIIINNFEVAHDAPEQNPLNLDQLKEIFGDTKIVIIYFHTVIADAQKSMYTEKVINKIVKTFDEDDSTCWSIITNQISLKDSAAISVNQTLAAAALAASQVAAQAATPEAPADVRAYITGGGLKSALSSASGLSVAFNADRLITDIQAISGFSTLPNAVAVKDAVAGMGTSGANATTTTAAPYVKADIDSAASAIQSAISSANSAAAQQANAAQVANLINALKTTDVTLFANGTGALSTVSFSSTDKSNVTSWFNNSANTASLNSIGSIKSAISTTTAGSIGSNLTANQITVLTGTGNNIDTWISNNPASPAPVSRSAIDSAVNGTPAALKSVIQALPSYSTFNPSTIVSAVSNLQAPSPTTTNNYTAGDITIAAAAIQAQITANPATPAVPAASAVTVVNTVKTNGSFGSASAAFKAGVNGINTSTIGSATDAYNAIKVLASEYVPSAYAQKIIKVLTQARDITVALIDASDDLSALTAIQNMPKDKAFVLLLDNFDLASSLLNRELVKYRSMALSERLNASGGGYAVCQFVIAFPASNYYLSYEAK